MADKLIIVAGINFRKGDKPKTPTLTDVIVRAGTKAVAFATLAGKWNAVQALAEFKKNPGRFAPQGAFTKDDLVLYAKAA